MFYIVYETTNKINGKKYRGAHVCEQINDSYIGSGKLLKRAIEKYGFDSFERTVLVECKNVEEMFLQEAIYVSAEWVADPTTYNLKVGGEGGWDYINKEHLRWNEEKKRLHSIEMKKKRESGQWGPKNPTYGFKGKTHTIESIKKISENNAMTLSEEEVLNRIEQWKSLPNIRGKITRVSSLWNISHTQVRRFVAKYNI